MTLFLVNLLLAGLWVVLWGDLSLYTILVGFVGGYAVLWLFTRLHDRRTLRKAYGQRVVDLLRFSVHFAWLLIKSNLQIAREIITPGHQMTPRIVRYEITGLTDVQTVALANAITLTPGTLVVDVRDRPGDGRRYLYVHCMYAADRDAAVADLDALRWRMEQDLFKQRRRPVATDADTAHA